MVGKLKRPKLIERDNYGEQVQEVENASDEMAQKKSRATSCARCKRRKQKCDHRLPSCTNCLKAGVPCIQPEKYFSQVPQSDPYITLLETKVAELEAQVKIPVDTSYNSTGKVTPSLISNISGTASIDPTQVKSVLENVPQSLNVVSSILDEQYRFSINKPRDDDASIEGSIGLLPDYNFEAFLRYKPIIVSERKLGERLYQNILDGNAGRLPIIDRVILKEIQEESFTDPENPDDPEYNYHQFLLYVIYALSKTTEYNDEEFQDFSMKKCKREDRHGHVHRDCLEKMVDGRGSWKKEKRARDHDELSATNGYTTEKKEKRSRDHDELSAINGHTAEKKEKRARYHDELSTTNGETTGKNHDELNTINDETTGEKEKRPRYHDELTTTNGETTDKKEKRPRDHDELSTTNGHTAETKEKRPRDHDELTTTNDETTDKKNMKKKPEKRVLFTRHFHLYSTALRYARQCKATEDNKIWQITALILCSLFQLHTDLDDGYHIDMLRRAAKMCIECRLHLEEEISTYSLYEQEMLKRLFWSVYNLERLAAVSIGREFVLADKDITVSFPADIEDDQLRDDQAILEARQGATIKIKDGKLGTSLSFLMCLWELRRIESRIFNDMYFSKKSVQERYALVHPYYDRLKSWVDDMAPSMDDKQITMLNIAYAKAIRVLIQPFLSILSPDSDYFKACVKESGRICELFRDFSRAHPQVFTTIGMNNAFVTGLTLVYCLWLAKDDNIQMFGILENLRVCSSLLYVLAERTHLAVDYREKFESLLTSTMNHIRAVKERDSESPFVQKKFLTNSGPSITPDTAQSSPTLDSTPPTSSYMKVKMNNSVSIPSAFVPINELEDENQRTIPISAPTSPGPGGPGYWTSYYGYDDSVFNMIQDISSWSRTNDLTYEGALGAPGAWTNSLTDFGYS